MDHAQFLDAFDGYYGEGERYRAFGAEDERRLEDLPAILRELFRRDGLCSYKKQQIWTCDPDEWTEAGRLWLPDHDNPQVFGRTSFGDLFLWSNGRCWLVSVHASVVTPMIQKAEFFLAITLTDKRLWREAGLAGNTRRAKKAAGLLAPDEIYLWVPALALGGSKSDSEIVKSKALEGLQMLRGLQEPLMQPG